MKPFLTLSCAVVLTALISSCQKEAGQAPAAKPAATAIQTNSLAVVPTSGLAYTVNLGMIDYYPFHGNANDGSGHGHNADVYSVGLPPDFNAGLPPPTLTKNKYGFANEAYHFDGESDEIVANSVFDATKPVTQFSFYVRYKSNSSGALLSSGEFNDPSFPGLKLLVNTDNSAFFSWTDYFRADGQITSSVGSAANPACNNSWIDVVVNYSNSILTLYINGKLAGTAASIFPSPAHFGPQVSIGYTQFRYPQDFFNSAIDEVRVYNRPLTTDEISYLYGH